MRNSYFLSFAALSLAGLILAPTAASAGPVCDLRTNTSCSAISGGGFFADEVQPAGTVVIDSFLRTASPSVQSDEKTMVMDGVVYRDLFLDVNQSGRDEKTYITLDQLELFPTSTGTGSLANPYSNGAAVNTGATGSLDAATRIYDLDAGNGTYGQIDYLLNGSGNGSSDVAFSLSDNLFTGDYVYLFSQFGRIDNARYASGSGFADLFASEGVNPQVDTTVPEPASLLLLGTGLLAAWRHRRRLPGRE